MGQVTDKATLGPSGRAGIEGLSGLDSYLGPPQFRWPEMQLLLLLHTSVLLLRDLTASSGAKGQPRKAN